MFRSKWLVFCAAILLPKLVSAQSMRLQEAPLGSVVQIGSFNYVNVAENKYMQSSVVTCPHGAKVGGQWVKCVDSPEDLDGGGSCDGVCADASTMGLSDRYAQNCYTCSTGYIYDSSYNSGAGDCRLNCGSQSSIDSSDPMTCNCDSGYYVNSAWTQNKYTTINTQCGYLKCGSYSAQTSGNNLSCTCTNGYTVDSTYNQTAYITINTSCPYLICGENSYNNTSNPATCDCDTGWATPEGHLSYTDYGNACTSDKLECGAHSHNNANNYLQCDCDTGYHYTFNQNTLSYVDYYTKDGGECKAVDDIFIPTSTISNFDYTGGVQTFTARSTGIYKLEVWGAAGGSGTYALVNYGGYSNGFIKLSSGNVLYVVVGQQGPYASNNAAYNGGGVGAYTTNCFYIHCGANGGGATHIATVTGTLASLSSNKNTIKIVAGGGGGGVRVSETTRTCNASGGGSYGGPSASYGGGQTRAGQCGTSYCNDATFGQGGTGYSVAGGGGGGYYGGAGGSTGCPGGGSGYIGGVISGTMYCYTGCSGSNTTVTTSKGHALSKAANTGNGYARITLMSVSE